MSEVLLTNSSVVLVIQGSVPSVTHEFLVNKKIIPSEFQIQGSPFYTPPVSQIKYTNGFNITTEPSRIQIMTSKPVTEEREKENNLNLLMDISLKYLKFFDDITCKSIGINFQFIRDNLNFEHLMEQTIKPSSSYLKFEGCKGEIGTVNVSYNWKGKQFNVSINKVQKIVPQPSTNVTFFNINVNYSKSYGEKLVIIKELIENFEKSQQFIKDIS